MEQSNQRQPGAEPQRDNPWDGKRKDPLTVEKEGWYDKLLARIPLTTRKLDVIIGVLILLLLAVLTLGYLKGNGLI